MICLVTRVSCSRVLPSVSLTRIFLVKLLESYFGKVSPFYFIKTLQINHAFLKNKNKKIKRKKNQIHSILLTASEKLCHRQNCVIT